MPKIATVIGARPQFIKAAAVSEAIDEFNKSRKSGYSGIREICIHTGQHYDYNMNEVFFRELSLKKADYNLNVGSCSHARQTARMLEGIEDVLKKESPDMVLVYGDTNSTLAGALAAKKLNILTAHVEAGLRSYNTRMPEELNRVIVDRISDILFCPSKSSVDNLLAEGIGGLASGGFPAVFNTGDVMYDTILRYLNLAGGRKDVLQRLSLKPRGYCLATVHRAENTDDRKRLKRILRAFDYISTKKLAVVFPVHPRTRKILDELDFKPQCDSLIMLEPLSYLDMLILEKHSRIILTDSGGVQKEAYFLGVPCITLRDETEWVETAKEGFNIVAGTCPDKIKRAFEKAMRIKRVRTKMLYGDGKAAKRIVKIINLVLTRCRK